MPKCSILGPPWRPAGSQMAPKIDHVAPKAHQNDAGRTTMVAPFCYLRSETPSGVPPGTILVDSGWIFYGILWFFSIICVGCLLRFWRQICRLPKPPTTNRTNGKHHEQEPPILNVQITQRQQVHMENNTNRHDCHRL